MKDLLVLVADKNIEFVMRGLLPRIPKIEVTCDFTFEIIVHPERDPGVYNHSPGFLRPFLKTHKYVLLIFDRLGSGQDEYSREEIEDNVSILLSRNGWDNRAVPIVIDPELENWIWVNQTILQDVITWNNQLSLFEWLHQKKLKEIGTFKPLNPKDAFEYVLEISGTPRSSALYFDIASRASYKTCADPAFQKMINQLKDWFSE
jgi:hypothetical protein